MARPLSTPLHLQHMVQSLSCKSWVVSARAPWRLDICAAVYEGCQSGVKSLPKLAVAGMRNKSVRPGAGQSELCVQQGSGKARRG